MPEAAAHAVPGTWLSASLAADADAHPRAFGTTLRRLAGSGCVNGPARVVHCQPGQHVKAALELEGLAGTVLVAAGLAGCNEAILGGAMAQQFAERGVLGVVTDGRVRDLGEIRGTPLSVWAAGTAPAASAAPATTEQRTTWIEDVEVSDGDFIVADDDGIVVWDPMRRVDLLDRAFARHVRDRTRTAERLSNMQAGPR